MLICRPRRNRKSSAIRALVQETRLHPSDLIYPLFVIDGAGQREPIASMPGIYRLSLDLLLKEIGKAALLSIPAVALFPVIPKEKKDEEGSEAWNPKGILQQTIRAIKREFPEICVIADVALDPYTSHGHDGVVDERGEVMNDETIETLVRMALVQAEAGVDMVAPSDMMDGRVRAIRESLDDEGFHHVNIHAYTAKYASAFYGPFRDALSSKLKFGDKKTYQMNPANQREALLEAALDIEEGADIIMVKPALPYLDVIAKLREATPLPISAYQVSGEYAMLKAAEQNGWIDGPMALLESVMSIKRAGADMIFTYAAPQIAEWLQR
ncbi:MAG: Delta-aminolevulinic acid dehydratase [Chlamydiae bacterium]|nr:Delta-aminolevulinic acid dehydratase [Chlamydiota bacterium]